jgi:hypothetical protein
MLLGPSPGIAAHDILTGLADIAEVLGKLQQSNLGADDLLFSCHSVLQSPRRGASQPRPAPRPASACDSPWGLPTSTISASSESSSGLKPRAPFGRPRGVPTRPGLEPAVHGAIDQAHQS